ncbi:L,D-transpeptidase family protein [Massilia sp. TWR1-2-2]|uniref:L,D-transpeptidase family protein n=1 Tax=Massilia sp. TWR1-2-2 TaxID=2804584 RepID=UPI003CE803C7
MSTPATKFGKTIKVDLAQQMVEGYVGVDVSWALRVSAAIKITRRTGAPSRSCEKTIAIAAAPTTCKWTRPCFFTLDGKALHQYDGIVPLRVVRTVRNGISEWFGSHGCVRLTHADAKALYEWAPLGTTVNVF